MCRIDYSILFIPLLLLSACNTGIKQANERGLEYMRQKQYRQAIAEFDAIISRKAAWYPAYYNRAISYANNRQYEEAVRDFSYFLTHFAGHAGSYFNRGIVYENMGCFANAIKDYSETIRLRPDFIMAYHYRGIARYRMNDLDGAIEDYNKALQLGRNVQMDVVTAREIGLNASALYYNRGVVMQKKGDVPAAIQDYTEAIRIDPSSAKAYYNRAVAQMNISKMDEARSDLEIASRLGYKPATTAIQNFFRGE